jgi:hypothetical protein
MWQQRLDVLATAITAQMTADEIENLTLICNLLSPALDPVLIAASELQKRL